MQQLHEIDLKIGFTTISECFHEVDRGGLSLVKFETFLADKPPMKKMFGTLSEHTLMKHRPCKHEVTTKFPKTSKYYLTKSYIVWLFNGKNLFL